MKTIEQIEEEINALCAEKEQIEKETLEMVIYGMFVKMTKEEVLLKIKEMMDSSPMLKNEIKRLLIDNVQLVEKESIPVEEKML